MKNMIANTFDSLSRNGKKAHVPALNKQISACRLAIEVLERERRVRYAAGEAAFQSGIRSHEINEDGVTGVGMSFADDGHKGYVQYSEAISEMEDMIEALQDADVVAAALPLFRDLEEE